MLKHDYADVNGVRLHYVSEGSGDLILFWHGNFLCWYEWKDMLAEFGKHHRAVAFDVRGYNLSSKPDDPRDYHPKAYVEDLRQLVEYLGYKKFTLVAHNGNGIPYVFASYYPEYLEKFIIINSPHPTVLVNLWKENPEQREASQYVLMFQSPEAEKIMSENNYAYFRERHFDRLLKQGKMSEEDLKVYIEALSQPGALTGALNMYRSRSATALKDQSTEQKPTRPLMINVPTLVIWSEENWALTGNVVDGLSEYVPDLTVKRFPGVGNLVVQERYDEVLKFIREFIESKK